MQKGLKPRPKAGVFVFACRKQEPGSNCYFCNEQRHDHERTYHQ